MSVVVVVVFLRILFDVQQLVHGGAPLVARAAAAA
jgi:hypothetical protein